MLILAGQTNLSRIILLFSQIKRLITVNKILCYFIISFFLASCSVYNYRITEDDLNLHISFLAGDSLKGRYPGTPEDSVLQIYLAEEFKKYGLIYPVESGLQFFEITTGIMPGHNAFESSGKNFISGSDFLPLSFSSNTTFSEEVVFAGYGLRINNDSLLWDDYSDMDVKGKWVMILRDTPPDYDNNPAFIDLRNDRNKSLLARDNGAGGVLMVSPSFFDPHDKLAELRNYQPDAGLPVIHIKRDLAEFLLAEKELPIKELEVIFSEPEKRGFSTGKTLRVTTGLIPEKARTANIIGYLKGYDPSLNEEYIVIGAHFDHLGMGGQGSSSRRPDTIAVHYGADDNASGVASVLELAAWFSSNKNKHKRSLVFALFGAEEKGLLGSLNYVENPLFPLESTKMMINIDMLGRMKPDSSLAVGGTGTTTRSEEILNLINNDYNFALQLNSAGYGPSDHASFYAKDIPVLFFSTGGHQDYHTPSDRIDSLDLSAQSFITSYIADVISYLANNENVPEFMEAGPRTGSSVNFKGRVTLGIMPDVSDQTIKGVKALAVTPGRPADSGGMLRGDIITALDGKPVENIYEYMYRLSQLLPGQSVIVTVLREQSIIDLLIQL